MKPPTLLGLLFGYIAIVHLTLSFVASANSLAVHLRAVAFLVALPCVGVLWYARGGQ